MELREEKSDEPNPFAGPVGRSPFDRRHSDLSYGGACRFIRFALVALHQRYTLSCSGHRYSLGHDLVDAAELVSQKLNADGGRRPEPDLRKFGVFRMLEEEFDVFDRKTRVVEQGLHVPNSKKAKMGPIQQAANAIFEIVIEQARQHPRIAGMRQRDDDVTVLLDQPRHSRERRPWIVEMFQHISGDNNVETVRVAQALRPRLVVQVEPVDLFAYRCQQGHGVVVDFHRCHAAIALLGQDTSYGPRSGPNVENALAGPDHPDNPCRSGAVSEVNLVIVSVSHLWIRRSPGPFNHKSSSTRKRHRRRFPK